MKRYIVSITLDAQNDISEIIDHIALQFKAPHTAEKYLIELYDTISYSTPFGVGVAFVGLLPYFMGCASTPWVAPMVTHV